MHTSSRPTLKDVAERAGVSPMVVSRVCHPRPKQYVAEATRQRVLDAIRELNYHPDSRARYLRLRRTDTIGFYSGYGIISVEHEFARVVFDGLQSACGEYDRDLLLFHPIEGEPAEVARLLTNSKVDGVIYHPRRGDADLAAALKDGLKPIVRVGEPFPGVPTVLADDYRDAVRLAHHLYLHGHRRVAFRRGLGDPVSGQRRYAGFCDAARDLGIEVLTLLTASPAVALTPEEEAVLRGFRTEGITAVACWRDALAAQVLVFCRQNQIDVPEDLAVAGFDGLTPATCPAEMRLTTIVIDWQRIVELALARLIDIIEGREVDAPDELVVPGSLYVGNTT